MALKRACDSCGRLDDDITNLPAGWVHVAAERHTVIDRDGKDHHDITKVVSYELCEACGNTVLAIVHDQVDELMKMAGR